MSVGGIAAAAYYAVGGTVLSGASGATNTIIVLFICGALLVGPLVASLLTYALCPREKKDGHTRCGKCGYILKGLTEPRCSECGERI